MDPEFITSSNVLVEKKLCREERDKTSHHQALTMADFQTIKHSQALDLNTPEGLVSKVWFDVQLYVGCRVKEGNC